MSDRYGFERMGRTGLQDFEQRCVLIYGLDIRAHHISDALATSTFEGFEDVDATQQAPLRHHY